MFIASGSARKPQGVRDLVQSVVVLQGCLLLLRTNYEVTSSELRCWSLGVGSGGVAKFINSCNVREAGLKPQFHGRREPSKPVGVRTNGPIGRWCS
jgi:hypothetical protein